MLSYVGILIGLICLAIGADYFVDGAANIARRFGVSPLIIGMSIVGLATSAPEILVGIIAAFEGKTEIAIGNAIGSNIANIGLVLGFTAVLIPVTVASRTLKREYLIMLLSLFVVLGLMLDRSLGRLNAACLLVGLAAANFAIIYLAKHQPAADPLADKFQHKLSGAKTSWAKDLFLFALGLALLLGGAHLLVESAVIIAKRFGLSDLVIGLTIIAVGTSLPELAASITAAKKNEADIAIGNVIGSNMFNVLAVIGIPAMIQPTDFSAQVLLRDFPIMIGLSLLMGWMVFIHGAGKFSRAEGSILLLGFIAYQYWLFAGQMQP